MTQMPIVANLRAVRDFDLRDYSFEKIRAVHMLVASEEETLALADQYKAWENWFAGSRASLIQVKDAEHAIPDAKPALAAALTVQMLENDKDLGGNRIYSTTKAGKLLSCKDLAALKADKCR